jgi:hypothetical protein
MAMMSLIRADHNIPHPLSVMDNGARKVAPLMPLKALSKPKSPYFWFLETRYEEQCVLAREEADATGQSMKRPRFVNRHVVDEWSKLLHAAGGKTPLEWQIKYEEALARYDQHRAAYPHLYH